MSYLSRAIMTARKTIYSAARTMPPSVTPHAIMKTCSSIHKLSTKSCAYSTPEITKELS